MLDNEFLRIVENILTNPSCSLYLYSCLTMNLWETVSNALSKSTKIVGYLDDAHMT
uniref:Uncharacterized protein n=1 Tax=Lepeophtheirus salmonis TaxID=72036 RepID=A0A0K2TM14_LEPSM